MPENHYVEQERRKRIIEKKEKQIEGLMEYFENLQKYKTINETLEKTTYEIDSATQNFAALTGLGSRGVSVAVLLAQLEKPNPLPLGMNEKILLYREIFPKSARDIISKISSLYFWNINYYRGLVDCGKEMHSARGDDFLITNFTNLQNDYINRLKSNIVKLEAIASCKIDDIPNQNQDKELLKKYIQDLNSINPSIRDFISRYADYAVKSTRYLKYENDTIQEEYMVGKYEFDAVSATSVNDSEIFRKIRNATESEIYNNRTEPLSQVREALKQSQEKMNSFFEENRGPELNYMKCLYDAVNSTYMSYHLDNKKKQVSRKIDAFGIDDSSIFNKIKDDIKIIANVNAAFKVEKTRQEYESGYDSYETFHRPLYDTQKKMQQNRKSNQQLL